MPTTRLASASVAGWKPARNMMNKKRTGCRAQGQAEQKAKLGYASEITRKGVVQPMEVEESPF